MAMVVQYLSSKLGIATSRDLPEMCRARFSIHLHSSLPINRVRAVDADERHPPALQQVGVRRRPGWPD